jgi:response regulator of citrate/malate metabolism
MPSMTVSTRHFHKGEVDRLFELMRRGDVAQRVGISRAIAQRYLSSLVHAEVVQLELNHASTGRPDHRYRLEMR